MKKLRAIGEDSVDWVRDQDAVVLPFYESLHGGSEIKQSTLLGGVFSLFVRGYVWYIMIFQAIRMFKRNDPGIISQEIAYNNDDAKIYLNTTSKHVLQIW